MWLFHLWPYKPKMARSTKLQQPPNYCKGLQQKSRLLVIVLPMGKWEESEFCYLPASRKMWMYFLIMEHDCELDNHIWTFFLLATNVNEGCLGPKADESFLKSSECNYWRISQDSQRKVCNVQGKAHFRVTTLDLVLSCNKFNYWKQLLQ